MTSLICKLESLPLKRVLYNGKVHAPKNALSYDLVKLIKDNGEKVDIVTFRKKTSKNEVGEIIRRYILKKSIRGLEIVERNYKKIKDTIIEDPENPFSKTMLKVSGRKISSVTKFDNEFWEKSEEVQTVTQRKNNSNVVHIKKIMNKMFGKGIEEETQSLYEYKKEAPKKGYTIKTCLKSKLGYFNDIFPPQYNFENFSNDLVEQFQKDPYFLLHLYSAKEFKKMAPTVASHPTHKLVFQPKIKWCSREKVNGSWGHDDNVYLNRKTLDNKLRLVNVAAHEKEHGFQEEQCVFSAIKQDEPYYTLPISMEKYEKFKQYVDEGGKYRIYSQDIVDEYWRNMQCYITAEEDLVGYSNQILERHANIAGALAEKDFEKSSRDLKEEFLYAPDYLVGVSIKDLVNRWVSQI